MPCYVWGFFALLRTGELLNLRAQDILLQGDQGIVSLFDTKTGKRNYAAEMVAFDDCVTIDLLHAVLEQQRERNMLRVPLWPHSAQRFRNQFKRYCAKFDMLRRRFRPYSMRRGGATRLFQVCGSMETALLKGRWASAKVAKIYICDALSFLPGMTFSNKATRMLAQWDPFSTSSDVEQGDRGSEVVDD